MTGVAGIVFKRFPTCFIQTLINIYIFFRNTITSLSYSEDKATTMQFVSSKKMRRKKRTLRDVDVVD